MNISITKWSTWSTRLCSGSYCKSDRRLSQSLRAGHNCTRGRCKRTATTIFTIRLGCSCVWLHNSQMRDFFQFHQLRATASEDLHHNKYRCLVAVQRALFARANCPPCIHSITLKNWRKQTTQSAYSRVESHFAARCYV